MNAGDMGYVLKAMDQNVQTTDKMTTHVSLES